MKLTPTKIKECAAWVEKHGLHPQPCGASIKDFCEAMGISDESWRRWQKKVDFVEAIAHAREKFARTIEDKAVNKLIERALGGAIQETERTKMEAQKVEEYDPKTGKLVKRYTTDKGVIKDKIVIKTVLAPDILALKYLLNNIAPEHWREKQDLNVGGQKDERIPIVVGSSDTAAKLREIIDNHAQPDAPATEDE